MAAHTRFCYYAGDAFASVSVERHSQYKSSCGLSLWPRASGRSRSCQHLAFMKAHRAHEASQESMARWAPSCNDSSNPASEQPCPPASTLLSALQPQVQAIRTPC
eukprot:GHUV01056511.1.p1 GENE.GHUV01056511.1~~GHUV01056511.1.p1  ORF type:complete len:105 (+),score=2.15 GHUV01056511.1:240-554(+)